MKILYISQYYPPEMGAPAARVSELARHWARDSHQVTVLTGFPNHPTGVVLPEYRAKFRHLIYREWIDGIDVVRTWLLPFANRRAYERLLNYLSFCLSSSIAGSFLHQPDVIIATSPQLFVGLAGWWLGRIKRTPFILEVRDLWPDSITASGMGRQGSMPVRALQALSVFLYRASDHIVVVSPAFKEDIVAKWNINPEKISLVENGVETELFSPTVSQEAVKQDFGLNGKFVVSYIGTLGLAHGLTTVLEAAGELKNEAPQIIFLLVGEGADKQRLVSVAREQNLVNVQFLPQQPREKIPALIQASDICLVLLKKAPVFRTVIPTKMLEFMACGRPVILGVDGQARQVLEEAKGGIFIEPENHKALLEEVIHLYKDSTFRQTLGQNGRNYIVEHLSREHTAKIYIEVLEKVISNCKNSVN